MSNQFARCWRPTRRPGTARALALIALLAGVQSPLCSQEPATETGGVYKSFGLSPDSRAFLYLKAQGGFPTFDLYIQDRETGSVRLVTDLAVHHAAWSPDGKMVAYQWLDSEGQFHVSIYNVATQNTTGIASGRMKTGYLEWSPDSAELRYITLDPRGSEAFETGQWDATLHRHSLRLGRAQSAPIEVSARQAPLSREAVTPDRTAPAGANWRLPYYGLAGLVQGGSAYSGGACDGAVCLVIAHQDRLSYALDFQQVSEANEGNQHILAVEAGTVVSIATSVACSKNPTCTASWDPYSSTCNDPYSGAGNHVVIAHLDGSYSLYAHLKSGSIQVKPGQAVSQGAYLADQGHSGSAFTPNSYRNCGDHLHYQRQTAPAVWSQAIPTDFENTPCLMACTSIYPSSNIELAPPPAVTAMQPLSGVAGSNLSVTLTGSDFLYGTTLAIGGTGVTAGTLMVNSATQATATLAIAPGAALGPRDVTVTTARGVSTPYQFQVSVPVAVTLATRPPALTITVDGQACVTPCTLQWHSGTIHNIAAPASVPGVAGTRLSWTAWSDGGTPAHPVIAPVSAVTYTAAFVTQHLLTTSAGPSGAGTITPATGWYDSGTAIPVSATAGAGFSFTAFSGALTGAPSSQTLTLVGPSAVTATFTSLHSLSRRTLLFGAIPGGAVATAPQELTVFGPAGINTWTATSDSPWLSAVPITGQRNGRFTISVVRSSVPPAGTYTGKVTVAAGSAYSGSLVVNCTLSVKVFTAPPFGSLDTPTDGATGLAGSIPVTGWALDDIGVNKVTIWRDPLGAEATHPNGFVYIGDAIFVAGARPDVESIHSGHPAAYRAGWGYLLLTNALRSVTGPAGNGVYTIHAFAVDAEGNQTRLGAKTVTAANQSSMKPFGTLDSPAPGETISGSSYASHGWALTPQPSIIPSDGSTVWVNIDGVSFAHPTYAQTRGDVASLFPGYANSAASGGSYQLDTTKFTNGMHTIAWIVYDDRNHGDGVGSRFFEIQNVLPAAAQDQPAILRAAKARRPSGLAAGYPAFRTGYDSSRALSPIRLGDDGIHEPVPLSEVELLEIHLPAGQSWRAALRFDGERRPLPIGSTFDAGNGIFYWQLGPGFLGRFELEFTAAGAGSLVIPVDVTARR